MTEPAKHSLRIGGLLRCCVDTWDRAAAEGKLDDIPVGGYLQCMYAPEHADHRITRFEGDVWGWIGTADAEADWPRR